jgi:hypothetical protein
MSSRVRTSATRAPLSAIDEHAALLRSDPLYLDRCQVDTPGDIVSLVWKEVAERRPSVGSAVEFGAGDGRFARAGNFRQYLGYEVDAERCSASEDLGRRLVTRCAFSHTAQDADVCIGNPPYVRNQDLPVGWREMAAAEVQRRTGVTLSGLANAWQYFLMLALWSVTDDGLVAMIVPYEWVSRPAAAPVRDYLNEKGWGVDVYRLPDATFADVTTAASLTVIDKRSSAGWRFFEMGADGSSRRVKAATGTDSDVVAYSSVSDLSLPVARRGLSPGTQQVLTLTEGQRVHSGLHIRRDVVRCVTSLRSVPADLECLTRDVFDEHLLGVGAKCWLIRTDRDPSSRQKAYLDNVDPSLYQTVTCKNRESWWRFSMPQRTPEILMAQAFRSAAPKAVLNQVSAHAVGGVAGVYNIDPDSAARFIRALALADLPNRLIPYAKEMRKLEINQINALLAETNGHFRG